MIYCILMKTELGKREGKLSLTKEGKKLKGSLMILRHTNPVSGEMDNDKMGWIQGTLQTYAYTLDYKLVFQINMDLIRGEMETSKGKFQIEGYQI